MTFAARGKLDGCKLTGDANLSQIGGVQLSPHPAAAGPTAVVRGVPK
jgi:hypothetical protein